MLHVFHSNRMEALVDRLGDVLRQPLAAPLAAEQIVVQNNGLARWLSLRLAERFGIAGNNAFSMPSSFVWQLFKQQLGEAPDTSPYDKSALFWRIFERLPDKIEDDAYTALRHYLADDATGLKRYQLARRIADVFDQYLVYRPQWILDWEQGDESHWQADLWRCLAREIGGEHRAALLQRYLQSDLSAVDLPQRVSVFGISSLPPATLNVLRHLAHYTDVYFFVLNPSHAYWGDILPEKTVSRLRERWRAGGLPDVSAYYETGNPLLAAWGRLGRDFQRLLYEDNVPEEGDDFAEPDPQRLLGRIQHDLLTLRDSTRAEESAPLEADDSLQIHACHSPLREVEVLHDRLLELLQRHEDLRPRDLVVMMPDVDRYAPYIEAVFDSVPKARHIPWSLADLSLRKESVLAEFVLGLLDLPASRFGASEILAFLEAAPLQRRLGLVEDDLPVLRRWVRQSGVRWGHEASPENDGELSGEALNNWDFGFRRLFFGYALPEGVERFGDIAPLAGVEGSEVRLLGILKALYERLRGLARLFNQAHSALDWHRHLSQALDDLLDSADDEAALESVRDALQRFVDGAELADLREPLSREVLKSFLEGELSQAGSAHRYANGRVTFCAMVPMRAVPFRVLALLGLNDKDFPRRARPLSFDLMASDPQAGDRSVRDEDRHLFLEALMSARDYLLLSYVGADARDDSELQPALMLAELMDYVEAGLAPDAAPEKKRPLVCKHPLQPFSPRYLSAQNGLFTYAAEWAEAHAEHKAATPFYSKSLADPEESFRTLSLEQLASFFNAPPRYFLQKRLGLYLEGEDETPPDDEPFELAFLERYGMNQTLLADRLQGLDFAERADLFRIRGELPHGVFGNLALAREQGPIEVVRKRVQPLLAAPLDDLEIDLKLGGLHLQGWLKGMTEEGLLTYRVSAFNGKDLMRLWLRHLVLNALEIKGIPCVSLHVDTKEEKRMSPLKNSETARKFLSDLLALYWRGLSQPLPLFPRSAYKYAEKFAKKEDQEAAMKEALGTWNGNAYRSISGEGEDAYNQVAFRGVNPLSGEFEQLARQVYGTALEYLQ